MAAWKQIVLALVIVMGAAAAWAKFFPGAPDIMARWGIDWANASTEKPSGETQATRQAGANANGGNRQGGRPQTAVVTSPVVPATINDRLQAIGSGRANASVAITPYDSGRMTEVDVTSGSKVEAGQVIARLDSDVEQIALDRARIAEADARAKLDRMKLLRTSNAATPVQVADAELVVGNAQLAVRDAELALQRRSVVSPISGIVGILPIEAGNYVTSQTTIATIDDRSTIVVDFWVPERYAAGIQVGAALSASPISRPSDVFDGTVSAVDNRIDEASRTLRVQARIDNANDMLRAGMSFQVTMKFPGDTYPSVNPLAIQWGTDGSFVWTVRDGKAARTPVRIVQRNTENVLVEADLTPGEAVVTEGVYAVREGAQLLIAGSDGGKAPATTGPTTAASGT